MPSLELAPQKVHLLAVAPSGPVALPVRPGSSGIHDVVNHLPIGIYEAFRSFGDPGAPRRLFRLDRHFDRADASLAMLGDESRVDREAVCLALDALLRGWPGRHARIRLDVLRSVPADFPVDTRTLLSAEELPEVPAAAIEQGVAIGIEDELRRHDPRIKHATWVLERQRSKPRSVPVFEMLLVEPDEGLVLECTSANFLGVRDGHLVAPADEILMGITRASVLDVARDAGIPVEERRMHRSELAELDEAMLTSSSRGIVPIVRVEDVGVGSGVPGPITRALIAGLRARIAEESRLPLQFVPRES